MMRMVWSCGGGGALGRWGIMPGDDVALAPLVLVGENLISSD
jgi:hypothetical protein